MEVPSDKKIAATLRKALRAHAEPYEEGAWELFLERRKKKRRAMFYWYGKIAAGFLLLFALTFLWTDNGDIDPKEDDMEIPHEFPMVRQNDEPEKRREEIQRPEKTNDRVREQNEATFQTADSPANSERSDALPTLTPKVIKDEKRQMATQTVNRTKGKDSSIEKNGILSDEHDTITKSDKAESYKKNLAEEQSTAMAQIDSTKSKTALPLLENEAMELAKTEKTDRLVFGLVLASGYNELSNDAATGNGISARAGFMVDLRLVDNLSISSGVTVATQGIASNSDLAVLETGGISQSRSETINLWNLDIPLDVKYTIPNAKKNIFVSAGVSSLITFNQRIDTENILEREVLLVQEVDGVPVTTLTTETVTSSTSQSSNEPRFYPAGILNLSAGFSRPLNDKLTLEVAPFFKYPIQDITSDNLRFSEMGIHLRMYFLGKKDK